MRAICTIALLFLFACQPAKVTDDKSSANTILITIKRDYTPRPAGEKVVVALDWQALLKRAPQLADFSFTLSDQHFGKELQPLLVDENNDGTIDAVQVKYEFTSGEPVYTWKLTIDDDPLSTPVQADSLPRDSRLAVSYLVPYNTFVSGDTIADWPVKIFESALNTYPDPADFTIISPGEWNYEHGFFLNAGFQLWKKTKDDRYLNYIKSWVDRFLTEEGRIKEEEYDVKKYRLDDILPGRLCIFLYQQTGDERYKVAAEQLREHLAHQPKTSDGGYWHKQIYPSQMWLDGIYMADIFSTQYAQAFNEPELFDEAAHQIELIYQHTRDTTTGLMYHGWDESKNPVWAHPDRGTSPEFWGRAMGWYIMALVDCLDYLPADHPDRDSVITILKELAASLAAYQDEETHLWYQVTDKGHQPDNWIETSCSAMYAYAFAKGYNNGYLDRSFYDRAQAAFTSLITGYTYYYDDGRICLDQTVKVGTLNTKNSDGSYAYYVGSERRSNDFKGLAALLYAGMELQQHSPNVE